MVSYEFGARDDILDKAQTGEITIEQAEAEAVQLGLMPLARIPDPKTFKIMEHPFWTVPMAIAWIAYRTPEAATEWCDYYRQECWQWVYRNFRDVDGTKKGGYTLERWPRATLDRLIFSENYDRLNSKRQPFIPVKKALVSLWQELLKGTLKATHLNQSTGDREVISAKSWSDLKCSDSDGFKIVSSLFGINTIYENVILSMDKIIHIWPEIEPNLKQYSLPSLMKPEGGGYMPLFCAAQWIVTKGGTVEFDPAENEKWHNSFSELLARISANDISVTGVTDGERVPVEHYLFAGIKYNYPWNIESMFNLLDSKDLYLNIEIYCGEEYWLKSNGDTLENRYRKKYTKLMVSKDDIARNWSFDATFISKNGAPGRPSLMHLAEAEFLVRCDQRKVENSVTKESEALANWLEITHQQVRPLTAKTIKNKIAARFRQHKQAQK